MGVVAWIIFGFLVGVAARAVVSRRQSMGFVARSSLGIAGAVVGGLVGTAFQGGRYAGLQTAGLVGSLAGAVLVLAIAQSVAAPGRAS